MEIIELKTQIESLVSQGLTLPMIADALNMLPTEHNRLQVIKTARRRYQSNDIEIDDNAVLSEGCDYGCFVQAWVFVDDDWLLDVEDEDKDEDDDEPDFEADHLPMMLAMIERANKLSNQELERRSLAIARNSGANRAARAVAGKVVNDHQLQIARMTALLSGEDAALVLSQVTALVAFRNAQRR